MSRSKVKTHQRIWITLTIGLWCFLPMAAQAFAGETYEYARLWPALQQPWYFRFLSGVAVDSTDNVYVLDAGNYRVLKFTAEGQLIAKWGREGSGPGEFDLPQGIAVDPSGFVYVADTDNHRIQKFTLDGEFLLEWGGNGGGDGQFQQPFGVATDGDGNVYVADTYNARVQKFSSEGGFLLSWGEWGTSEGYLTYPQGIMVDDAGVVYVTDANNALQRFSGQGELLDTWGGDGTGDGALESAYASARDESGNVYVTDYETHLVIKYASNGQYVTRWGGNGTSDGKFTYPKGVAVDGRGHVYVVDFLNDRIQKFLPDGSFVAKWGSDGEGDGQFFRPFGLATASSGNLYAVDSWNDRIQEFTPTGTYVSQRGGSGTEPGRFTNPRAIAVDGSGNIYVTDVSTERSVQKFSPTWEYLTGWGSAGEGDGQFDDPVGVATDGTGHVYVCDRYNHRVQKFTDGGVYVTQWGGEGSADGKFKKPGGIAVGPDNYVYVADTDNHRIQKFTSAGDFVMRWGTEGSGVGQFFKPTCVTVDAAGNVYVAEWLENDRIQKFSSNGDFLGTWGAGGTSAGQLSQPVGLTVGSDGTVFVSEFSNNRIQAFFPSEVIASDKAVIVAGGGPYPGNNIWDATQMLTAFVYRTLRVQGFDKENIYYVTAGSDRDPDGNGLEDDLVLDATRANLSSVLTSWAVGARDVVVYLADHGGDGTFRINETEVVNATELDGWLDTLQEEITGRAVVVYEACYSGSFVPLLTAPEGKTRLVVTSASAGETAQFVKGTISFSDFFWKQVFSGATVGNAFDVSRMAMPHSFATFKQTPLLDADGNGIPNEDSDLSTARNITIGFGNLQLADVPVLTTVSPVQTLSGETSATLWTQNIATTETLTDVWAVITPPDYVVMDPTQPVTDLPVIALSPAADGKYEGSYGYFSVTGTYDVSFYAMDDKGYISLPKTTQVIQTVGASQEAPANGIWTSTDGSLKFFLQKYQTGSCVLVVLDGGALTAFLDTGYADGINVSDDVLNQGRSVVLALTSSSAGALTVNYPSHTTTTTVSLEYPDTSITNPYVPPNGIWNSSDGSVNFYLQKYETGSCVMVTLAAGHLTAFLDPDYTGGVFASNDVLGQGYTINLGLTETNQGRVTLAVPQLSGTYPVSLKYPDAQ